MTISDTIKRFTALKQEAQNWEPAWKDIQKYILPTHGMFDEQPNRGQMVNHKIVLDGHPARAARILAAGMTSGLTSPSRPWFKLGVADQDLMEIEGVKFWLDTVQGRMMNAFSKSNIYGTLYGVYYEIGGFGTAAMALLEDFQDIIRAKLFTIGEYRIGTSFDGRIDTMARTYYMTTGQMLQQFGEEALSTGVQANIKNKQFDIWVKVNHIVMPNDNRDGDKYDNKNMPWKSCYWEEGQTEKYLSESGFTQFPVMAPRWNVVGSDIYGKGPGWETLGDVKMLMKMQHNKLVALDKMTNPPVQIRGETVGEANMLPGGITRFSAGGPESGVSPSYNVNTNLQALEATIQQTKEAISKGFYSDLFMMISNLDNSDMTAREIVERHEEKLLMLGPVLERLESELLDPLIDRTFGIMLSKGLIPTPPVELQGMDLKVEYISMLAQAQKLVGTGSINGVVNFVTNIAQAIPSALDLIDIDETIEEYADMYGVPAKMIRSREEVASIREDRNNQAMAVQKANSMAAMVPAAKTLSDTKLGQNSALDALMNGGAAQ